VLRVTWQLWPPRCSQMRCGILSNHFCPIHRPDRRLDGHASRIAHVSAALSSSFAVVFRGRLPQELGGGSGMTCWRRTEHGSGLGRWRWVVERTFAWLNQFRRLRIRYDKRADIHEAFLSLGCALICWQRLRKSWMMA
jgi:transposase